MKAKKPSIAVFGMGTFDKGLLGAPVLIDLFERLSADFDIVFYSFLKIDASHVSPAITIRQPVDWPIPGRVKYFLVALRCLCDHFRSPMAMFFSVSVYPTGKWAVWLGKILRKPVLVQLIASEAVVMPDGNVGSLHKPWLKKITMKVCRETDVLLTVCNYQRKLAEEHLQLKRKIDDLPLRVNTSHFIYSPRSISFPVQFIHVAFYSEVKDQDTMFVAFEKISRQVDSHLTVIGVGFDTPKVHTLLKSLSILDKVTFTGFVSHKELPMYFERAHILLHTAIFETGCAVIQEAMASGVAVGGTHVGLLHDIGNDYAVVVPPRAADELAEKIITLINDPVRYQQMTRRAYEWITTYDAVWSYQNYKAFLSDLLNRPN